LEQVRSISDTVLLEAETMPLDASCTIEVSSPLFDQVFPNGDMGDGGMSLSKRIADLFTFLRVIIAPGLVWLGLERGEEGLSAAIWTIILSWTSDSLDGPLARRSKVQYNTWIGDHDLEIDMLVSVGLCINMFLSGFVSIWVALIYLVIWGVIFWRFGNYRSLGMLFQAPIYGWFLVIAMRIAPTAGSWMIGWIVAALIITWPRFPNEVVPGFIKGMTDALRRFRT
jgi:phosphatidylglycerophosphate synthase